MPDDPTFAHIYTKADLQTLEDEYIINGSLSLEKKWAMKRLSADPEHDVVVYRKIPIPEAFLERREIQRILSTSGKNT